MTLSATAPTQEQTTIKKTMDQDLFQFFDSLSQPSPVGEWFTQQGTTATSSVQSSPDIATPLDIHLSPSTIKAEATTTATTPTPACLFGTTDLDMSEILNSPLFDSPVPPVMTPAMTPATPHIDMFTDLNPGGVQDLPSALAAFVAAVSAPQPTVSFAPPPPPVDTGSSRKRSLDEPVDEAALKRQKNTDAARRSRLKKVLKMESLEKRVNDLERMNAQLLLRVAVLDSEKSHLVAKEAAHDARVKTLETQLAEAHKALSSRSL
ncbi:hypothetical protein BC941DRAFT_433189 [Chlamydoabsidia padenii]|nr:hypothetical protein BC941DRAFT_433189 [Chlamydoabsidia padenii]